MNEQNSTSAKGDIPVLWPETLPNAPIISPHAILCKQAEWITWHTNKRVIGRVHSKTMGRSLSHTFSLTCPCFLDYAYFVARVRHSIDVLYPLQLFLMDSEGTFAECRDETEFLDTLGKILHEERIQNILYTLMAHAIPPEDWLPPVEEIK